MDHLLVPLMSHPAEMEAVEISAPLSFEEAFHILSKPVPIVYVDHSLAKRTIRYENAFRKPRQMWIGMIIHMDATTWQEMCDFYRMHTAERLEDLVRVHHIRTKSSTGGT